MIARVVALTSVAAISFASARPAFAQSADRSVDAAVRNTACALLLRTEGFGGTTNSTSCDNPQAVKLWTAMQAEADDNPNWVNVYLDAVDTYCAWMANNIGGGHNGYRCTTGGLSIGPDGLPFLWNIRENADCKTGWQQSFRPCSANSVGLPGSGDWDDPAAYDCDEFTFRVDEAGRFVIPTIPLTVGRPMYPARTNVVGTRVWRVGNPAKHADSAQAVALWWIHNWNAGVPQDRWQGVYSTSPSDSNGPTQIFNTSTKSYWTGTSWSIGHTPVGVPANGGGAGSMGIYPGCVDSDYSGMQCRPCPDSSSGGGDFDFYIETGKICVMYAPNKSISPSGYFYPSLVSISMAEALLLTKMPKATLACQITPDMVRLITEYLWRTAAAKPGYTGPAPQPITPADARNGGIQPRLEEMKAAPNLATGPTPTATSTPTPPAGGGGGDPTPEPTVAPPASNASDPVAPTIDWWPDLPTITVDLGAPVCPTYQMSVPSFGWDATVDAHCSLIEQVRSALATIMVLIWTVTAVMIILKA